jgi:GTP-binding protein
VSRAPRPVVALVGRPNVGKSTLFNRLARRRIAIVEDVPGVTRDRNYADVEWDGRALSLVDTGGFEPGSRDRLVQDVRDQARLAVDEASAVVLVADGREGLTAVDLEVADVLRRSGKPLFVAVNKLDGEKSEREAPLAEFHRLGFGGVFAVSAEHGRGVSDLVEAVLGAVEAPEVELREPGAGGAGKGKGSEGEGAGEGEGTGRREGEEGRAEAGDAGAKATPGGPAGEVRIAVVGRPNVGKSTFVNALLGEQRLVVSEIPGTTRDAIDSLVVHRGRRFVVTDTAGIRRKRSIAQRVEAYSVVRAMRAIDDADVAAVLLDAGEAGVEQDARLLALVAEKGRALLVVVNKWDLAEREGATQDYYRTELRRRLPFVAWAPVLFASALTGKNVTKLLDAASRLVEQHRARFPTRELNDLLEAVQEAQPAPLVRGRRVKLYYVAQVAWGPPTFVVQCNHPEGITERYRRFVENRFREPLASRCRCASSTRSAGGGGARRRARLDALPGHRLDCAAFDLPMIRDARQTRAAGDLSRKQIKAPDRFQVAAAGAAEWLAARRTLVAVAAGVAVAAVVSGVAIRAWQRSSRDRAGGLLYRALDAADGEISPVPIPGVDRQIFRTDGERQRAVAEAAGAVRVRAGGTGAGRTAALLSGSARLRLGEWDAALADFRAFLAEAPPDDTLRFAALDGVARAQEGKGDLEAAARSFEQAGREAASYSDRAALERARVLVQAGKPGEARKLLQAFPEEHKDSPLRAEAQQRLARLGQ